MSRYRVAGLDSTGTITSVDSIFAPNFLLNGDFVFGRNTNDGSDTGYASLTAANASSSTRSGRIVVSGNERGGGVGGWVDICAGGSGKIVLRTNSDTPAGEFDSSGQFTTYANILNSRTAAVSAMSLQTSGTSGPTPYAAYTRYANSDGNQVFVGLDGFGFYGVQNGALLLTSAPTTPAPIIITRIDGLAPVACLRVGGAGGTSAQVDVTGVLNTTTLAVAGVASAGATTVTSLVSSGTVTSSNAVIVSSATGTSHYRAFNTTAGASSYSYYENTPDVRVGYAGLDGTGFFGIEAGAYLIATNQKAGTPITAKPIILAPGASEVLRASYNPDTLAKLVTITGDLDVTGTVSGGTIVYSSTTSDNYYLSTDGVYGRDTVDGSDTGYAVFTGAGADGSTRGGRVVLSGNDRGGANAGGQIDICAGASGAINFRTNSDALRGTINSAGVWTVQSATVDEFLTPLQVLAASNTTAGYRTQIRAGVAASASDSAQFGIKYQGADSSSNRITMGLYSYDDLLQVTRAGELVTKGTGAAPFQYTEGTWTPGLDYESGGGTTTPSSSSGYWTKVGKSVTLSFHLIGSMSGVSAGSSGLQITGIPFVAIGGEPYASIRINGGVVAIAAGTTAPYFLQLHTGTTNWKIVDTDGDELNSNGSSASPTYGLFGSISYITS